MLTEIVNFDLRVVKSDLLSIQKECYDRGLVQSAKWSAELLIALKDVPTLEIPVSSTQDEAFLLEYDRYTLARTYFDLKEYERVTHLLRDCVHPKVQFFRFYSQYLAGENKRVISDSLATQNVAEFHEHLKELRLELQKRHRLGQLDGFHLYLYGVVLKKLDLTKEALEIFQEAVTKTPLHWGSWLELAQLVSDRDMLNTLVVPEHWMKQFFTAHVYLALQLNEEALNLYKAFRENGFTKSTYVMAQVANAYQNLRAVDEAVELFQELEKADPYRLDNMDTYSNLLYVREKRPELATLAHKCCEINKYRVETCCVIGNYYSLRAQHEKAVLYFQRALKLNPNYLAAWTLMGHEFMEIKNTPAAIQAYRQAVEVDRRDYRAWYGLGQTYEILKMPSYSLYYYRQAQMLRPNDSRMAIALGECYEKLDRLQEAKKCYWKGHSLGDVEGLALIKLARLYEKLNEVEEAAAAYTEYINESEKSQTFNPEDLWQAYKYIANYHLNVGRLDDAYVAARKCTEFAETREEGKALLRQISRLRSLNSASGVMPLDDSSASISDLPQPGGSQATPIHRFAPKNLTFTP